MYYLYMGSMQIPIPPPELKTSIMNKNTTIDLMSAGEVNILKSAGLTEINFEMLLPNSTYPFNQSILMGSKKASYYADQLEAFKVNKQPFQFIVVRMTEAGTMLNITNMKVSLEDYSLREAHGNGYDMTAEIKLKKYVTFGSKKVTVKADTDGNAQGVVSNTRSTDDHTVSTTATAGTGSTLQQLLKKQTGKTDNLFAIASLNKIAVPAVLAVGQVIKLKSDGNGVV